MSPIFEKAHRQRISKLYSNLSARAKPKLWKRGKKKGKVRVPGLSSLPFWQDELWAHVTKQIPDGGALCPYCRDHGRSTLITLDTFVLDHHIPLKSVERGVDPRLIWDLSNLICVCADDNNIKGSMSYTAFIVLMRDFLPDFELNDRKYITSCLRTHGQVMRGFGSEPKAEETAFAPGLPLQRNLNEEF